MERLASWASRYGQICLYIRPFTRNLYCAYAGKGRAQSFALDEATLRSMRVIRLMLVITVLGPLKFSRPMRSFRLRRVTVIIEFDASLSGIGIIWYVGNERPVGAVAVDISLLGFGEDSQFQNSVEFIAATIGLLGLILLGLDGSAVRLRGDSMLALCWGAKMNYKGARTANAALVFTLLLVQAEVTIVDFEYLTSKENLVMPLKALFMSRGVVSTFLPTFPVQTRYNCTNIQK
jgi:hypothetical protein